MVSAVHEVAMSRSTIHFVAIATRSHLAQAAVLAQSLDRVHPDVPRTLFLVEPTIEPHDADSGWCLRLASELPLPEPRRFLFQYTPFQLCCALKPFALEAVMPESQEEGAVYLDTDLYATASFLDVVEQTWALGDVALTPHLKSDSSPSVPSRLLRYGAYNAGFLAVRATERGRRFLHWLQKRLLRECIRDIRRGLFDDQKWLDLAAAVCEGVVPIRCAGLNVGHWNRYELQFDARPEEGIRINGREPLRLLHLSKWDKGYRLESHSLREADSPLRPIFLMYQEELHAARQRFPPSAPYGYGMFHDGAPIEPIHREAVRLGLVQVSDPFMARSEVEMAARKVPVPPSWREERMALGELARLRAHPVIGRVWRLWKRWVNHDLP